MKPIFLVCGVPGSGKTWVCSQLTDKFEYIRNDDFIGDDYVKVLCRASRSSDKPILADCPFAERKVREELTRLGCDVRPYFIVEPAQTVRKRYEAREGRPVPTQHLTRAMNIGARATEWRAPQGSSAQVLELLKSASL